MSKKIKKKAVGIFMVGALVLIVVAVMALGSAKLFKKRTHVVMYFQHSVSGLNVGSPVVFHGVRIGSVTAIRILLDPKELRARIPVYAELDEGSLQAQNAEARRRLGFWRRTRGCSVAYWSPTDCALSSRHRVSSRARSWWPSISFRTRPREPSGEIRSTSRSRR